MCPLPKENGIPVNPMVQGSLQTDGRVLLLLNFCHSVSIHRKTLFHGHSLVFSLNGGVVVRMHRLNEFCFLKKYKEVLPNRNSKNNTHWSEWVSVSNINMTSVILTHFFLVTEKIKIYYESCEWKETSEEYHFSSGQYLIFIEKYFAILKIQFWN